MSADNPYEFLSREEMKEILLETRDQLPNRLAELREQIALEIEAYFPDPHGHAEDCAQCEFMRTAAAIARGKTK